MLSKIIKKHLGQDEFHLLRLLRIRGYNKFFIFKIFRRRYTMKYNEIRIYLRPWIKSDITGTLGFLKHSDNNYLNEISRELKNKVKFLFSI